MSRPTKAQWPAYLLGFGLSVGLSVAAYLAVSHQLWAGFGLVMVIAGLAAVQLVAQLVFFLHFGSRAQSQWNLVAFLFMLLVLVIIVGGSIWIMHNLDYNMMPQHMDEYMLEQNSKGF